MLVNFTVLFEIPLLQEFVKIKQTVMLMGKSFTKNYKTF